MPDIIRSLKRKLKPTDEVERCGIVLHSGRVLTCDNQHPEPTKGFIIPAKFLRSHLESMAGTWHTHPKGNSQLSQEDYQGFSQWPGYTHYIVSPEGVLAYEADQFGLVKEVDLAAH